MISTAHLQRLITGLTLLAILIAAIFLGGWYLRGLILVASMLALYEFYAMFWPGTRRICTKALGLAFGAAIIAAQPFSPMWIPLLLCLIFLIFGTRFLLAYGSGDTGANLANTAFLLLGLVYIPCNLQSAMLLSPVEQCLVVGAAIATDAGGYYAGSAFGNKTILPFFGPKVWPSVSPKKSWAGSLGGLALCVLLFCAIGLASANFAWPAPALPLWAWAVLGVLMNLAAQFGDFFESALKRSRDIKDSGSLLPGHGGLLDRIDSILFALPLYLLLRSLAELAGIAGPAGT